MDDRAERPSNGMPESVFFAWLIGLPENVDITSAASAEIARIDKAAFAPEMKARLTDLLAQATLTSPGLSRSHRRQRH